MLNSARGEDRYQAPAGCIRAARSRIAEAMRSLEVPSTGDAERCVDLLYEAGVELQSAAGMLRGMERPGDAKLRLEIERLRQQLKTLAQVLCESDRLVSGWMRRMESSSGGYTEQGVSAPLVLVKKLNVTG